MSRPHAFLLVLLLSTAAVAAPRAVTWHATADGRATATGTSWQEPISLTAACQRAAAGDVVLVRAGPYNDHAHQSYCYLSNSGTAAAPITVRGETVPVMISRAAGWAKITGSYVIVENMGCDGVGGACVVVDGAHHVLVRNLHVSNAWRALDVRRTDDSVFEGLTVRDAREGIYLRANSNRNLVRSNVLVRVGIEGTKGDRCAICIGERNAGRGNRIIGNVVMDAGGKDSDFAIAVYSAPGTEVANNVIRRSRNGGIAITQYSMGSSVVDNVLEDGGSCPRGWSNIAGITVRNGSSDTLVARNHVIRQTVCRGNPWGDTSPRGAIDLRGWPGVSAEHKPLERVALVGNVVTGTIGGRDLYIHPGSATRSITVAPP